jgi:hypothetical protein
MSTSSLALVPGILDNENRLVERADQKSISLLSISVYSWSSLSSITVVKE